MIYTCAVWLDKHLAKKGLVLLFVFLLSSLNFFFSFCSTQVCGGFPAFFWRFKVFCHRSVDVLYVVFFCFFFCLFFGVFVGDGERHVLLLCHLDPAFELFWTT